MTQKESVRSALQANKDHQSALAVYSERLEAELKAADKLIGAVEVLEDEGDDPEGNWLVSVTGAVRPVSVVLSSSLMSENSPFYEDAKWRQRYEDGTSSVPMRLKEHEALAGAVRSENQRMFALAAQKRGEDPVERLRAHPIEYFEQNKEGLDWRRISMKVNASIPSGTKRSAKECEIRWLGHLHPDINRAAWSPEEVDRLRGIVADHGTTKLDWSEIAKKLATNRSPIDCLRHGIPRRQHVWTPESDQKLLEAVELYGQNNWQLIAKNVSEDATAQQCQKRFSDTIDPSLKHGLWSKDEDEKLLSAVAAFLGVSRTDLNSITSTKSTDVNVYWHDVALFVPGRNNNHCRERYQKLVKGASENRSKAAWTAEEDSKLLDIVKRYGPKAKWKRIAQEMEGRTDNMCRKRYDSLMKGKESSTAPSEPPLLELVLTPDVGNILASVSEVDTSRVQRKAVSPPRAVFKGKRKGPGDASTIALTASNPGEQQCITRSPEENDELELDPSPDAAPPSHEHEILAATPRVRVNLRVSTGAPPANEEAASGRDGSSKKRPHVVTSGTEGNVEQTVGALNKRKRVGVSGEKTESPAHHPPRGKAGAASRREPDVGGPSDAMQRGNKPKSSDTSRATTKKGNNPITGTRSSRSKTRMVDEGAKRRTRSTTNLVNGTIHAASETHKVEASPPYVQGSNSITAGVTGALITPTNVGYSLNLSGDESELTELGSSSEGS